MNPGEQRELQAFVQRIDLSTQLTPQPDSEASAALHRLAAGEAIDAAAVGSIEAVVLAHGRPLLPVKDGTFDVPDTYADATVAEHREEIGRASKSVGRINMSQVPGLQFAGSGFMVGPDLVMTTRGLAELFATGVGRTGLRIKPGYEPRISFDCEHGSTNPEETSIVEVVLVHPFLDVALLRVASPSGLPPPLVLMPARADDLVGRSVAVIGHIAYDPTRDLAVQNAVFQGRVGDKHVSPGRVLDPAILERHGHKIWALTHDCSTLSGSAGGPVVDASTGAVVGLHVTDTRFVAGYAIPVSELARDGRIASLLTFTDPVQPSDHAWDEDWAAADPETVVQKPSSARPTASQPDRDAVRSVCRSTFSDAAQFVEFLNAHGFDYVVAAVPPSNDQHQYFEGLLNALERRGKLDEHFLQKVRAVAGTATTAAPEPGLDEPALAETIQPALLPPMPGPAPAGAEPAVDAGSLSLPDALLRDLVSRDFGDVRQMQLLATGSRWHDRLQRPDGEFDSVSTTIDRLARDPSPESRDALRWLIGKLLQTLDNNLQEELALVGRAYAHLLTGFEQEAGSPTPTVVDGPVTDANFMARGVAACRAVGLVELPGVKSGFVGGTGWLLTPSLVVVPAHLVGHASTATRERAAQRAATAVVRFDFDTAGAKGRRVRVAGLELFDESLDLAILRLAKPVKDRAPLRINADPPATEYLTAVHHPQLGPKRISLVSGRLLKTDEYQLIYTMPTEAGSAGAPVFDLDWRVVATHRAWQQYRATPTSPAIRAKSGTSTGALLAVLRESHGLASPLWREIVAGQPDLKFVDPAVYVRLQALESSGQPAVIPIILEVLDSDVSLDDVPGLEVRSRSGGLVTASGTKSSVEALASRPDVLSVRTSHHAGALECARSVPHIGALRIQTDLNECGDRALIGVIDNGVDIFHRAMLDAAGNIRIVALWDQKDRRTPVAGGLAETVSDEGRELAEALGITYGVLYVQKDLQDFITGVRPLPATFPAASSMMHGTAVCSIAAGRRTGESATHFSGGVAPAASLVVVRYDLQGASIGYADSHIDAITAIGKLATRLAMPVVLNISNGMNAGAHDGTSPVEQACQNFTQNGQAQGRAIVKSAGNERGKGRHALLTPAIGTETELRWVSRPTVENGRNAEEIVELWFNRFNRYEFRIKAPLGDWSPTIKSEPKESRKLDEFLPNGNHVLGKLTLNHSENGDASLRLIISPGRVERVAEGEWTLEIFADSVSARPAIHAWVEEMRDRDVHFLDGFDDGVTVTIPGTAEHVITVGAIEVSDRMRPYERSSVGPARNGREKPEVVAPGVELRTAKVESRDGIAEQLSGTSFAAPHVTGAIALAFSARAKAGRAQVNTLQIRTSLLESLRHLTPVWNVRTGYGELDAEKFVDAVLNVV